MKGLLCLTILIPLTTAVLHNHAATHRHREGNPTRADNSMAVENPAAKDLLTLLARVQEVCSVEAADNCFNGCIASSLHLLGDGGFDYEVWERMIVAAVADEKTRTEAARYGVEAAEALAGIEVCQAGDWLVQILAEL